MVCLDFSSTSPLRAASLVCCALRYSLKALELSYNDPACFIMPIKRAAFMVGSFSIVKNGTTRCNIGSYLFYFAQLTHNPSKFLMPRLTTRLQGGPFHKATKEGSKSIRLAQKWCPISEDAVYSHILRIEDVGNINTIKMGGCGKSECTRAKVFRKRKRIAIKCMERYMEFL
jgi:hypothetical protein